MEPTDDTTTTPNESQTQQQQQPPAAEKESFPLPKELADFLRKHFPATFSSAQLERGRHTYVSPKPGRTAGDARRGTAKLLEVAEELVQNDRAMRRNELEFIRGSMNRDYMGGTQPEESDEEVENFLIRSIEELVQDLQERVRAGWETAVQANPPSSSSQPGGGQPDPGVWQRYMLSGTPGIVDLCDTRRNLLYGDHDTRFLSRSDAHWMPLWLRHVGVHAGGVSAGVIACALADLWRLLAEYHDDDASLIEVFGIAERREEDTADRWTMVLELLMASALWEGILGSHDDTKEALVHVYATELGDYDNKYRQHAHMAVHFDDDKVVLVRIHAPIVVHVASTLVPSAKWPEMLSCEAAARTLAGEATTVPHATFRSRSASPASSSSDEEEEAQEEERPSKRRRRRIETMSVQLRYVDTTTRSFRQGALDTAFESLVRCAAA